MENLEFCDKHNIVNWEYILLGMTEAKDSEVCKITRADGSSSFHGDIQALLRRLDRQDLSQLYSLVQERFKDHPLEGHDLDLWGDLRMIFDPNEEDDIWLNQQYWELLRWKLHEYSGVHSLFLDGTSIQINMLVEKKYPLKKAILEKMINLKLEAEEERKEAKVFERILSKSKSFNSRNLRFEVKRTKGDEEVVVEEGVVRLSSSFMRSTNSSIWRFFFSVTLIASSSSNSSSTKGGVLDGGGVSANVTLSDSLTFLVYEQNMQQMLKQAKILKGSCLNGLSALKSHFTRILEPGITKSEFERAFSHIFGEDVNTFTRTFSQNMDTLEQQLTKETILESNCQNAFSVLKTQFENFFSSVLIKPSSLDGKEQLDKEEFQEIGSMAAFKVLETQFKDVHQVTNLFG
ncbi:hypothetical protein Tco_0231427 [Tanacetum coccineum]